MSLYEEKEQETSADTQRHCRQREPPNLSDVDTQRTTSSRFSGVSMKSNNSMFLPPDLSDTDTRRAASPGFSCVSMKSNNSMFLPPDLSDGPAV
ncbi:hypothetical protein M9458_055952, partial [Cirrhinus mrigala]